LKKKFTIKHTSFRTLLSTKMKVAVPNPAATRVAKEKEIAKLKKNTRNAIKGAFINEYLELKVQTDSADRMPHNTIKNW